MNIVVDVFDEDRECSLPLLTTGLSAFPDKEPFRTWGDSTPQRYVVEEGIKVVPHDRCPHCWQVWEFKLQNSTCQHCGTMMGDKCKLLLDTDECPWCNEGKVTVAKPRCDKCGHAADRGAAGGRTGAAGKPGADAGHQDGAGVAFGAERRWPGRK